MVLHHINLPNCGYQLARALVFQRRVLVFACSPETTTPLTSEMLVDYFGNTIGVWLWSKLWTQKRDGSREKSVFYKELEVTIEFLVANPTVGADIIGAFDHDVRFHKHIGDPTFEFYYWTRLSGPVQAAVKGLMQAFYLELLSKSGFPPSIQGSGTNFTRSRFLDSFWQSNPDLEVCPACDSHRPARNQADADHFLPKSNHPFLAIHPSNLVPLCTDCNRYRKLDYDPIDDHTREPLLNTYHPYYRPAIDEIVVRVSRGSTQALQVHIQDNLGMPSRRVDSLNRVFKLEKHWTNDRMKSVETSIRNSLAGWGRLLSGQGIAFALPDFVAALIDERGTRNMQRGKVQDYVLESSYLSYVIADDYEREALFAQFLHE
jgi:hypothetical protein